MAKPSIVLVHGSWHSPAHFELLINSLDTRNYKCVPVALPSTQSSDEPPANLSDDTAAVRSAVTNELEKGNDVVVVSHSYGGVPANNALKGLDRESRSGQSAVIALAFLCSVPLGPDTSFSEALGGHPAPIHDRWCDEFTGVGEPGPEHYFYNDLPAEEAKKWSALLRQQAWPAYTEKTTSAGFLTIPSSYLFCDKDQAIPIEMQRAIVEGAKVAGARFGYVESFDSSHSPFLSMPDRTADFIAQAASGRL